MTTNKSPHDLQLERILNHPNLIGLEPGSIEWIVAEMRIMRNKRLFCEIDIVAKAGGYFVGEYKRSNAHFKKAMLQLERASQSIEEMFGHTPTKIYILGPRLKTEYIYEKHKRR